MSVIARAAAAALVLIGLAGPALAGQACDGSGQASPLQNMPSPLIVAFQNTRTSAQAKQAAASFEDGLRAGGVNLQPNAPTLLHLTFLITVMGSSDLPREYTDFSWTANAASGVQPIITVTAGLTKRGQQTLMWVASLSCKVKTQDRNVLAQELGQVIGEMLSKQLYQKSF
jgi:hypothetical protein